MTENERAASAFIASRIHRIRRNRGLTLEETAARVGMGAEAYRRRERGLQPITVEFALRCQLALGLDIRQIWFPADQSPAVADSHIIRELLAQWSEAEQPVTPAQIVELCAEAFGVSPSAIRHGLTHRKVQQARAAAAIVVTAIPHLQLSDLAPLVGRSTRTIFWIRKQAETSDPEVQAKAEQILAEALSL